jgi:hypothetical protein
LWPPLLKFFPSIRADKVRVTPANRTKLITEFRARSTLTFAQTLLVAQADLTGVVHLGADRGVLVQIVFSPYSKFGVVAAGGPRQLDAGFQFGRQLLVDGAAEFLTVVAVITRFYKNEF